MKLSQAHLFYILLAALLLSSLGLTLKEGLTPPKDTAQKLTTPPGAGSVGVAPIQLDLAAKVLLYLPVHYPDQMVLVSPR